MFKLIIGFGILAAVFALPQKQQAYQGKGGDVPILRLVNDQAADGSYTFGFETGDGTSRDEVGRVVNAGTDNAYVSMSGTYKYTDPEGKVVEVSYTADENGFVPVGNVIPDAITNAARSLGGAPSQVKPNRKF